MSDPRVNILIVDDLRSQQVTIEAALVELDENVVCFSTGRQALKYLLEHEAAVILLDVNMPEMDGFETAALIRKRQRSAHTPIIFLTADTDELLAARGYAMGAVDYIIRPLAGDVLRSKVRVFVELSRARAQAAQEAEQRIALSRARAARAAAEEQTRRLQFLASATGVLSRSLESAALIEDLFGLFVPTLADTAGMVLLDPGEVAGETRWIRRTSQRGGAPGWEAAPEPPPELTSAMSQVLATAQAVFLPEPPATPVRAAVLPFRAHGTMLGALAIAMEGSGRSYSGADVALFQDVVHRTGIALENRRLYRVLHERDRRKDEFLAMLSHELRNPLGAIATSVHLLELLDTGDPRITHARDVIRRQSLHLTRMVDDLLEVSRVTAGRISLTCVPVDLRDAVDHATESLRVSGRLDQHELSVTGDAVMVHADRTRLEQIVSNLLVNAIKYTRPGGQIAVQVGAEDAYGTLTVTDDGIGMPPELLPNVFDLFVQGLRTPDRPDGGLGIGLTLVKKLVQLQDGSVEARSAGLGHGSTFVVRLPHGGAVPAAREEQGQAEVGPTRLRVLIVDDNADFRQTLRHVLELQGHVVIEEASGLAALEAARETRPQLALIDLGLPGIDGYEVARRLRADEQTRCATLAAITGYGQLDDRHRSEAAGFDAHLVKPISSADLSTVIERAARRDVPAELHEPL